MSKQEFHLELNSSTIENNHCKQFEVSKKILNNWSRVLQNSSMKIYQMASRRLQITVLSTYIFK